MLSCKQTELCICNVYIIGFTVSLLMYANYLNMLKSCCVTFGSLVLLNKSACSDVHIYSS